MLGSAPLQSDVRLALLSRARGMDVGKVGVVGAGTMGNGIAHVFARSGLQVILSDIEPRLLDRAIQTIEKILEREVAKTRITAAGTSDTRVRLVTTVKRAE